MQTLIVSGIENHLNNFSILFMYTSLPRTDSFLSFREKKVLYALSDIANKFMTPPSWLILMSRWSILVGVSSSMGLTRYLASGFGYTVASQTSYSQ